VLHAFQKATRKTDKTDIDLAKRRLGQLIRERWMQRELQGR
jgi:phage-related protein